MKISQFYTKKNNLILQSYIISRKMPVIPKIGIGNSIFNNKYRVQLLASLTVHLMTFAHGIGLGWLSPALHLLQSDETPLNFSVSVEEASWIGSIYGLGSLAGNIIFGFLLDRVGRKWCLFLVALPYMCLWFLIYFAQQVEHLYVARFMGGMTGGGNFILVPIFIGEIAESSIRGALNSMATFFTCFGLLIGYIFGTHLSYFVMPWVVIALPICFLVAVIFLKDTPQYLLKKGNVKAAEESFRFYKKMDSEKIVSTTEMQEKHLEFNHLKDVLLKGNIGTEVTLQDFLNKRALGAFLTAIVIIGLNQFSGSYALLSYTAYIFTESGVKMDPNTATIIVGVVQIMGTLLASFLVERCGRRVLILTSGAGMGLGMLSYGLFIQFVTEEAMEYLSWLPVLLMTFILLLASIGVTALLFVIIIEILPTKIRSTATAMCMAILSCMIFAALKVYPLLIDGLGISVTMFICAGVCTFCFTYLLIFLPETKGKSLDFD